MLSCIQTLSLGGRGVAASYCPQRSWGKVMFLHVSVILFTVGGIPACLAAGLHWGVVSQHALQVSRPTPKGEVEGSGLGGLHAHTWGVSPGPHPGGVCVCPSMHWGRPPPMTATAAGGTHPTGMHSCFNSMLKELLHGFHFVCSDGNSRFFLYCFQVWHIFQPNIFVPIQIYTSL